MWGWGAKLVDGGANVILKVYRKVTTHQDVCIVVVCAHGCGVVLLFFQQRWCVTLVSCLSFFLRYGEMLKEMSQVTEEMRCNGRGGGSLYESYGLTEQASAGKALFAQGVAGTTVVVVNG